MPKEYRFSFMWSDELGQAIKEQCQVHYPMALVKEDAELVQRAVNQGIDAHLEACFCPSRGDSYDWDGQRLRCVVSPESLPVLVRRLLEMDNDSEDKDADRAGLLASAICSTLDIELI